MSSFPRSYPYFYEDYYDSDDWWYWLSPDEEAAFKLFCHAEKCELVDQILSEGMTVLEHITKNYPDYPLDMFFTKYSHLQEAFDEAMIR